MTTKVKQFDTRRHENDEQEAGHASHGIAAFLEDVDPETSIEDLPDKYQAWSEKRDVGIQTEFGEVLER